MNEPPDPHRTVDDPADLLDAGLAAAFGRVEPPRSSVGSMRPVLLQQVEGDSGQIVKPKTDAMPPPDQTGDRYQLAGEIARGGMGAVLRGRDVDLGRDLAVKVLLEKYVNRPEVARRFIEEAQIGGQLQHPGVVPVYDIGRFGNRPFFTMKLVKGQTLAALLSERADPAAERPRLLAIALRVAQTVAYAHAKGVIHRDLKPANIMVGAFGEVQVMDWGLAKVLAAGGIADEERASRVHEQSEDASAIRTARSQGSLGSFGTDTEAGSLLGTPAYMPPEQANGDVALLDRRADVFGLGAILCEILTGKPPYVGRSHEEVRRKAANGDLADARERLAACKGEAELIALIQACLSAEVADRPKDAQAVADGLTVYLDGVQDRLRRAELAEAEAKAKAVEEAKRRRLTLALAATVLLAVTLGGGGWLWVKADHDARLAQVTREVNEALNRAAALREQARTATSGSASKFAQAREQAQRALALVENGTADPALVAQVRRLQTELDEDEKDRKLLADLEAARLAQVEVADDRSRFGTEHVVPKFREAFAAYGLPVGQGEPTAAAERIRLRPAAVQDAIVAALEEWDELASSKLLGITEPHRDWLRALLRKTEAPEGWAQQLRAALEEKDEARQREALEKLAGSAGIEKLPARALTRLAARLETAGALPSAVQLLRRAQRRYPADFWVNHNLGQRLQELTPPQRNEAVRYLTVAAALRPDSPGPHMNLGSALGNNGQVDEAIVCLQKAVELDPKLALAHAGLGIWLQASGQSDEAIVRYRKAIALDPKIYIGTYANLAQVLQSKGRLDEAIEVFRKVIAVDPKNVMAHHNLGTALASQGQTDEAIAIWRRASVLDPRNAGVHNNLGIALRNKGRLDEAIASHRKAIEIDPNFANAYVGLGSTLLAAGQVDEAIASYRKAIEIDPNLPQAYINLAPVLQQQGRFVEALAILRRGHELGSKQPGWRYPTAEWVQQAERLAALEEQLAAFLAGEFQPRDTAERLVLTRVCQAKKFHAAGAKLYAGVFAAEPRTADDLRAGHRYNAACFAALAAAGQGADAAKLDDRERVRLRKQALTWLRADLALWTTRLESGRPADRAAAQQRLKHWQQESDLGSIRDAAALARLPAEERTAFTQLWADVAALVQKVGE